MTQNHIPVSGAAQALLVAVALRPELSRAQRRRFFGQMHRALRAHGLVLGHRCGICMVVIPGSQPSRDARHIVVDWLIDQQETVTVIVHHPAPVHEFFTTDFQVVDDNDEALDEAMTTACRSAIRMALIAALVQCAAVLSLPLELTWARSLR